MEELLEWIKYLTTRRKPTDPRLRPEDRSRSAGDAARARFRSCAALLTRGSP
ncbi:MAG: hypothetical protein MZV64_74255 [Ignavibacteriales bacterium]|nr:hypothetical protein [Ignavibacteriales bacterium]